MKRTKKVISIILAVTMVLTAIPTAVLAATINSKEDSSVQNLLSTMETYENKMDGTIYTKMDAAYTAYVNANKAYDAYVYGDESIDLSTYTKALNDATNAMAKFTDPVANATIENKSNTDTINSAYATSLLYADKQSKVYEDEDNTTNKRNVRIQIIYSANTIALYTGSAIRIPVEISWYYDQTGFSSRKVYAAYPTEDMSGGTVTDNKNFQLVEKWHGSKNSNDDWNAAWADTQGVIGAYNSTIDAYIESSQDNRAAWNREANYLTYIGGDTGFTSGLKTVSPSWYILTGQKKGSNEVQHKINNIGKIYVIDYKSLSSAMASNKAKLANVKNAKQGGMSDVISKFETAITAANNVVGVTPSTVSTVATAVYNAGNALNSTTVTADSTSYQSLRDAIETTNTTYNSTASDKYTTASWTAFTTAYDDAKAIMANVLTTGYNNPSDAKAKADALIDAQSKLEVNFTPANVETLMLVIDDAVVAIQYKNYFTANSWAAAKLEQSVPAAKTAVWGSTESYKDTASIQYTDDEQAKVDAYVQSIGDALMALEIDKNATVSSAKGYSMNSAIEYANTFSSVDYKNFADVTTAVNEANGFYTHITDRNAGAVSAKVNEYRTDVETIIYTLSILQPAFSKLANGTVANAGIQLQTRGKSQDTRGRNEDYELSWIRNTDQIIFRTNHDAAEFDLGGTAFNWIIGDDTYDYDNLLDSINLASSISQMEVLTTKNQDNNDWGLTEDQLRSHPGNLSMSSGTGTIAVKNLHVVAYSGAGDDGQNWYVDKADASGNRTYHTSDDGDITDLLATSEGTAPISGGVIGHAGTTTIKGDYTISFPSTTKKSLTDKTTPTMTVCANSNNLGFLHHYKYYRFTAATSGEGHRYKGYAYGIGDYSQQVTIVDISTLIDLFDAVKDLNEYDYTIDSWQNFQAALQSAKADMNYAQMDAESITKECVNRYTALYSAWKALKAPLTNTSIELALGGNTQASALASEYGVIYSNANADKKYTTSSYATFQNAYATAYAKIFNNGVYSDANIRNIENTDANQALVDSFATALTDAIAGLKERADVTALRNAVSSISIENNKYTVSSLKAVADMLNALEYVDVTDEELADMAKDDHQASIDAETETINSISSVLVESDASAVEAVKEQIDDQVTDPDAWDVQGAYDYIDKIVEDGLYDDVSIFDITVTGIKLDADDADEIVTSALSMAEKAKYTVYVDGKPYGTFEYGEKAKVSFDEKVDIFYAYISKVASNVEVENGKPKTEGKYFTTDSEINFIVKGDTYLTTHKKTSTTTTHKVTYINAVTNRIIAIDYVEDGETVDALPAQPILPFYTANGYELDGSAFTVSTPVTSDIIVSALYAAKQDKQYTIHYNGYDVDYVPQTYKRSYNGVITFYREDAVCWASFDNEKDFTDWLEAPEGIYGIEHIVYYGNTYSFRVHEDAFIVSLSQEDLDAEIETGFLKESDIDVVSVKTTKSDDIIQTEEKLSIINTYVMSDKYELIEAGLLFAKSFDAELKSIREVDNETVYRLKSTQQTDGNKYVISILKTEGLHEGQEMKYTPYVIYRDKETNEEIIYISPDTQQLTYVNSVNV